MAQRRKFTVKLLAIFILTLLYGCATNRVALPQTAAYRDCVNSQAMTMVDASGSANEIALLAAAQCQGNLALINEKLREENAWLDWNGSNSDAYTEKLRDASIRDAAKQISAAREQENLR